MLHLKAWHSTISNDKIDLYLSCPSCPLHCHQLSWNTIYAGVPGTLLWALCVCAFGEQTLSGGAEVHSYQAWGDAWYSANFWGSPSQTDSVLQTLRQDWEKPGCAASYFQTRIPHLVIIIILRCWICCKDSMKYWVFIVRVNLCYYKILGFQFSNFTILGSE